MVEFTELSAAALAGDFHYLGDSPVPGQTQAFPDPERELDLNKATFVALAQVRANIRRFLHFADESARTAGLTSISYQALLAVAGCPEGTYPTIKYLAGTLLLKHNSVCGLVDRLEKQKLLKRMTDPNDRRCVILFLTDKGRVLVEEVAERNAEKLMEMRPSAAAVADELETLMMHAAKA